MKKNRRKPRRPGKDDFARFMMDRIRQAGEKGNIAYDPEEFRLRGDGKTGVAMFLGNAYQEYCDAKEYDRERIAKNWIRNWFVYLRDVPDEFPDAKPDLMPVVRSRSHFELNSLRGELEGGMSLNWPYQILGEHFGVAVVYDLPGSMRSVPQENLDTWGVTFYEALEAAKENLLTLPPKFIGPPSGTGAYLSATGDNYDASRLLLTDLIRQFQVGGDPIAMIPNRDNLIVVGSDDDETLAGMLRLAGMSLKEPRPISGIALRLDGDEWTPWLPEVSHPLYKDFQQLQIQSLGQDYATQKDLLDKLHAKKGEDIFVATFSVIETPDGRLFSYSVWPDGADPWLPKTDTVAIVRLGGQQHPPALVEWQRMIDEAGELIEAMEIYPPRYRVRGFPSETQLAAMGNMLE
jgi:uncharacterized protein YtpQ (UPF0354 family)